MGNYESDHFNAIDKHFMTFAEGSEQIEIVKASGARSWDAQGRAYLNMNEISCSLGYNHPKFQHRVAEAVLTRNIGHLGNVTEEKEKLVRRLMELTHNDFEKVYFGACGGSVVDWSIKLARRYTGKDRIISFHKALHGLSFAGAWLSGIPSRKESYGSGLMNVSFWNFPTEEQTFEPDADQYEDVAAIIIEPYQSVGGMVTPNREYWKWLRAYTKEHGIVLIFDEVQTGFGRTGSWFAYEQTGIVPDLLLLGKGMSNGFGIGDMLISKEVASCMKARDMTGGSADNELFCSIINTVIDIFEEEEVVAHAKEMGEFLKKRLWEIAEQTGREKECKVYGNGLFLSLEMPEDLIGDLVEDYHRRGILVGRSGNKMMLRPPLVITKEELKDF